MNRLAISFHGLGYISNRMTLQTFLVSGFEYFPMFLYLPYIPTELLSRCCPTWYGTMSRTSPCLTRRRKRTLGHVKGCVWRCGFPPKGLETSLGNMMTLHSPPKKYTWRDILYYIYMTNYVHDYLELLQFTTSFACEWRCRRQGRVNWQIQKFVRFINSDENDWNLQSLCSPHHRFLMISAVLSPVQLQIMDACTL